jgi:outer membrane protein assembly factor BamB
MGYLTSVALAVLCLLNVAGAADWPFFRGPDGNGITSETIVQLQRPAKVWDADVGSGNASVVVQDGRAYTVGYIADRQSVVLSVFDAATGRVVWQKNIDSGAADSSPAVVKDRTYLLCHLGPPVLRCMSTADGGEVWHRELMNPTGERSYGHAGSPLVRDGVVYVNVGTGAAVRASDGEVIWQQPGLPGLATPVLYQVGGKTNVLIFGGDTLYARDARTGQELWSIPWKTDIAVNACDPIYHDGKVFICTSYGLHAAVYDVTVSPPRELWRATGSSFSSGFLYRGNLYCFSGPQFTCLDFATGQERWRGPDVGGGSAIVAGDKVLLMNDNGTLRVAPVSPDAFRPIFEARVHNGTTWTPPAFANGLLYVRNKQGYVVCVRVGASRQ